VASKKSGARTVETVVTFLEMTAPPSHHVPAPSNVKLALMRAEQPPVHFYRYLYDAVGRDYAWVDRKKLSDEELKAALAAPGTEIFVAYAGGVPAGYFELDCSSRQEIWLRYFGLIPDFQGRGLGKWLLYEALGEAWLKQPERVRVETCTLDGPRALPLYQRMGFRPYERRNKTMELLG
jgi:GNAT superfamily N-acetyltransferase